MARRRRGSSSRRSGSMQDRMLAAVRTGVGRWVAFTFGKDTQKAFGAVSHVLLNWIGLFVLVGLFYFMGMSHILIPAVLLLAGIVYTAVRAARHLPAQRKAIQHVFGVTQSVFKHPRAASTDPSQHVTIAQWGGAGKPARGHVTFDASSPLVEMTGRVVGERSLSNALSKFVNPEKQAVLFDHSNPHRVQFEVVDKDDERVVKQDVERSITQIVMQGFPTKKGQDPIDVAFEWSFIRGDHPNETTDDEGEGAPISLEKQFERPVPVPSLVTVGFGNYDVSSPTFRSELEANLDARMPPGVVWLYDWGTPHQLSMEAASTQSSAARRKTAQKRMGSVVRSAVAKTNTTAAKSTIVDVTTWIESGEKADTPRHLRVEMGDADMSDKRAQRAIESTIDRALRVEYQDRVWLHTWTHSTPTTLESEAVPNHATLGKQKIEQERLREVVSQKFRAGRNAAPPELTVEAWGKPDGSKFFLSPDSEKIDWEAHASDVTVNFGGVDVSKDEKRREFQLHFDSLVEGVNDWHYDWNPSLGTVKITSVPVLPKYIRFPDEGSPEADEWHDNFRQGKIALGPAKGGITPLIDFNKSPHMLVGGSTGAGKSYLLNLVLYGALRNNDVCELVVIDPKATDFTWAAKYPNVRAYAVTDARESVQQIHEAVAIAHTEMMERQNFLRQFGAENMEQLREFCRTGRISPEQLSVEDVPKRLILFFDEGGSAFTASKDKDIKAMQDEARTLMEQLAMLARAMEVNIVMAAQKPSAQNIGTAMREQLVSRIAVGFLNAQTSMQVLDNTLATDLLNGAGKGRGVLSDDQGRDLVFQTFYLPRVDSPDLRDKSHTIAGIQERIAERLEGQGWVAVPVKEQVTINRPNKSTGKLEPVSIEVVRSEWVRADAIED